MDDLTCCAEGHRANAPASPQPYKVSAPEKHSGRRCEELPNADGQTGLLSSSRAGTLHGKKRLRVVWRDLAISIPDFNSRLAHVVRLINAGECSLLPTPCASDAKRWPGSPDHPRLQRSRGLRLQEELGARPAPEIVEWMMGFPVGWTDCRRSETLWSQQRPSGSDGL